MRIVAALCVFLCLSMPSDATFGAVYDLVKEGVFGVVDTSAGLVQSILKGIKGDFRGFPLIGFVADEGIALANGTGSIALSILRGSNRMMLPVVKGLNVVIEIPFQTALMTPLRLLLEDTIRTVDRIERGTFGALDHLTGIFDSTYKETQGIVVGFRTGDPDIVPNDDVVLGLVKVLNATMYSSMGTILKTLSSDINPRGINQIGHRLLRTASANVSAASASLNRIQSSLSEDSVVAMDAVTALTSELYNLQLRLDARSDMDGIAESVASVIYSSVRVLIELSAADIPEKDLSDLFVYIIEAAVDAVNGGILVIASREVLSSSNVTSFINTALAPLGISETVTLSRISSEGS